MPDIVSLVRYLERFFLPEEQFIKAANISSAQFNALVEAEAIPGPIYRIWKNGSVWSPIGGQHGNPNSKYPDSTWYAAAAVWLARQAKILMKNERLTSTQVASIFKSEFATDFRAALLVNDSQLFEYQALFNGPDLDEIKLAKQLETEWQSWILGGYAVCLRRWDGSHPVIKNIEIARIRTLTDDGTKPTLTTKEQIALLSAIKRLDAVMLPFAPYQRPVGSPGKWVDQLLGKYELGHIPLPTGNALPTNAAHLRQCC